MKGRLHKGWLAACAGVCAGALAFGGIVALSPAESVFAADGGKVYYYVDCGNLVNDQGEQAKDRNQTGSPETGYPNPNPTGFMTKHGLSYGTSASDISGAAVLYNSVSDKTYGADEKTGKEWGYETYGDHNSWRYVSTSSTNDDQTGFKYSRIAENKDFSGDKQLVYKFEVEDSTTELAVVIGMRTASGWGSKNAKVKINNGTEQDCNSSDSEDRTYYFTGTGDASTGKNLITVTFPVSDDSLEPNVSWILIASADHPLAQEPVTCSLADFVKKGDTTIEANHSKDGKQTLTLKAESQAAINQANYFDSVSVTATYQNKEFTDNVTVLPKSLQYFANVGAGSDNGLASADIAYSAEKGYGYLSGHANTGWGDSTYDQSCSYGSDGTPVEYQFDIKETGSYAVAVGTVGHWTQYKEMLVSLDDAAQTEHLSAQADATGRATYYTDVTVSEGSTPLKVKVGPTDPPVSSSTDYIITFIVVYKVNKITYDVQQGEAVAADYFEIGESFTVSNEKTAKRDGFTFGGWFKEADCTTDATKEAFTESATVYAKWDEEPEPETHTVTFNLNGGAGEAPTAQTVNEGENASKPQPDPTRVGYDFGGWYKEAACEHEFDFAAEAITEDTTVYAKWTAKEYTITYELHEGVNQAGAATKFTYGVGLDTLPVPTRDGYTFDGWYKEAAYTTKVESIPADTAENVTLHAKWTKVPEPEPEKVTVTFDLNGGDGTAPATQTIDKGTKATKPATNPTRDGYTFKGWFTAAEGGSEFDFTADVNESVTVYAQWTKDEEPSDPTDPDPDKPQDGGCGSVIAPAIAIGSAVLALGAALVIRKKHED